MKVILLTLCAGAWVGLLLLLGCSFGALEAVLNGLMQLLLLCHLGDGVPARAALVPRGRLRPPHLLQGRKRHAAAHCPGQATQISLGICSRGTLISYCIDDVITQACKHSFEKLIN